MIKRYAPAAAALFALSLALISNAQAQTGGDRLPWGALKAGNADGSIPAWTGGMPVDANVPGFKKDSGSWPDPFAADKPLYTITAANAAQYADKLSETTKELLKRYPSTFRLDVFPSRRPANYSQWFNDNATKNAAGRCKTIENGEALSGCFGGTPFPVPKTGNEAMWNLILVNKASSTWSYGRSYFVDGAGNKVFTSEVNNRNENNYYNKNLTLEQFYADGGQYFLNNNTYTAPARVVGEGNLQRKWINPVAAPDKSWSYSPGQRRVRLSPDTAYDFPVATSAGAMLYDEIYVFNGKMDRYDWKYLGTKEMIIPYNGYRAIFSKGDALLMKGHPNPDVMRWELHRVNIVEATLKPNARHVMAKRRYYFDEDIPSAAVYDAWDASGKLARGLISQAGWAWDKQVVLTSGVFYFELNTGAWYTSSQVADHKGLFMEIDTVDTASFYSPDGLARRTQR